MRLMLVVIKKHMTSLEVASTMTIRDTIFLWILSRLKPPFGHEVRPKIIFDWLRAHLPWTQGNKLTTQDLEASKKSETLPPYETLVGYFRWCGFPLITMMSWNALTDNN